MKDIKSLYLTAKSSGREKDIAGYMEAVRDLLENKPNGYVFDVEYIISSNIGLATLNEFVERHGLSLAAYDKIMLCLEDGIKKCRHQGQDATAYNEAVAMMEAFASKYQHCFTMFENFQEEMREGYTAAFYSKSNPGALFSEHGYPAAADLLIRTEREGRLDQLLEYFINNTIQGSPFFYQWIIESCQDFTLSSSSKGKLALMKEMSLEGIVDGIKARSTALLRESVLTGNDELMIEYSHEELQAMEDLISFKEYMITCTESSKEIMKLQGEVYELYEMFEGLVNEDVAGSIAPMLPQAGTESSGWVGNTTNKKTGEQPNYLKTNHNMDDDFLDKKASSEAEPSLDDFKRPGADNDKPVSDPNDEAPLEPKKPSSGTAADPIDTTSATQNYYYYTYNNSNNTNTGSFNRRADNSVTNNMKTVDNSQRTTDDHSVGKRINSDNTTGINPTSESAAPWELDLFKPSTAFTEEVGDADDNKPTSDHPIKDTLTDIDRKIVSGQQAVKKGVQDVQNVGRAIVKPAKRTSQWVSGMVNKWKDTDENNIKEKMADPHQRGNLFKAIKQSILAGSLFKAGLLFNPIFLFLAVTKKVGSGKKEFRLRNEMIGEIKAELEIIDMKISDAAAAGDHKAKYQMVRFKNELNKKLIRVGGSKKMRKIL